MAFYCSQLAFHPKCIISSLSSIFPGGSSDEIEEGMGKLETLFLFFVPFPRKAWWPASALLLGSNSKWDSNLQVLAAPPISSGGLW